MKKLILQQLIAVGICLLIALGAMLTSGCSVLEGPPVLGENIESFLWKGHTGQVFFVETSEGPRECIAISGVGLSCDWSNR